MVQVKKPANPTMANTRQTMTSSRPTHSSATVTTNPLVRAQDRQLDTSRPFASDSFSPAVWLPVTRNVAPAVVTPSASPTSRVTGSTAAHRSRVPRPVMVQLVALARSSRTSPRSAMYSNVATRAWSPTFSLTM